MDILHSLLFLGLCSLNALAIDPVVLWSQKSHGWSKLRGVLGNPEDWINDKIKPYVQSDSLKYTFRYALSYHPSDNEIYWSDLNNLNILKQDLNSTLDLDDDAVTIMDQVEVGSLAVDWLAGNLYFIDRIQQYIAVMSLKYGAKYQKILLQETTVNPAMVVVDPYMGLLFWSDADKRTIESSTGTGANPQVIIYGLQEAHGLTLDITKQTLYFTDSGEGSIYRCNYDGTGRRMLYTVSKPRPYFGIALHQDYIFVTTGTNLQIDLHSIDGAYVTSFDVDAEPYDIISVVEQKAQNHECQSKGCEQLCLNVGGGHKGVCSCETGKILALDGSSCTDEIATSHVFVKDESIIFSDAIIQAKPHQISLTSKIVRSGAKEARSIGVHYEDGFLFHSDISTDAIYKGDVAGNSWREITVGTRHVEGITVDWTSHVIYWTDKTLGHIMCSRTTGHYHRVHLDQLNQPLDLTIDSVSKRLVWTSLHGTLPRIETVDLNGQNHRVMVEEAQKGLFKGIVMDPVSRRIFWSNSGDNLIESIDLNGQDRRTAISATQSGLYGVAVFAEFLIHSTTNGSLPQFSNMASTQEVNNVHMAWAENSVKDITTGVYDIAMFSAHAQPPETNGCTTNNGDCSHLCFPAMGGRTCGCAIGYVLNTDGRSCDSDVRADFFLLYVDPYHKHFYQIHTSTPGSGPQGIPVSGMDFPVSVDYDMATMMVYWLDTAQNQILQAKMDGTGYEVVYSLHKDSKPQRIVIDPTSQMLYYTDQSDHSIHRVHLVAKKTIIFESNINNVMDITVDTENRLIYWTNGNEIGVKLIDDNNAKQTVLIEPGHNFTGLSIYEGVLYACDKIHGHIYMLETNTSFPTTGTLLTTVGTGVYGLAADAEYIYYILWNEKGIYRINKTSGEDQTVIGPEIFARITDIKVFESVPIPDLDAMGPPGITGSGNVIVIASAAAGGVLFLLLLALLFWMIAACAGKRRSDKDSASSVSSGFENMDRDLEYMMFNGGVIFDNRESNKQAGNMSPKGSVSTDSGVSAISGNSTIELVEQGSSSANVDGVGNSAYKSAENGVSQTEGAGNGGVTLPIVAAPPLRSNRYTKKAAAKKNSRKSGSRRSNGSSNEFELRGDKKVATVIQRLANRLRKRLSSVRYDNEPQPRPTIFTGGPDVTLDIDPSPDHGRMYPDRGYRKTPRNPMDIPHTLHREPRGWAPASHNVPRPVKQSLGRAKGQMIYGDILHPTL